MGFKTSERNQLSLLAHGDQTVGEAMLLDQEQPVSIKVKQENGFNFFVGIHEEQGLQVG